MKRPYHLVLLVAVFGYLFYPLATGSNVFVFDGILLLGVLRLRPEVALHTGFRWAVAGLLASAVSVVVVHTPASQVAHGVSFLLVLGFAQARELRFIWYALLLGATVTLRAPLQALRLAQTGDPGGQRTRAALRWIRLAGYPVLVLLVFLVLYATGNSAFDRVLEAMSAHFAIGQLPVFKWILLALLGTVCTLPFLYPDDVLGAAALDAAQTDRLRRRRRAVKPTVRLTPLSLPAQLRRGLLLFTLLNALLLLVNVTDLCVVWGPQDQQDAATLSEYVHAGTTNLVISILLAMAIVIYYFRANLNFYRPAAPLRYLAYTWLAQNAFLALSVGLRNYHYIAAYGLAYGRVYVVFGLLLMLVGLFTLYRKVRSRLSFSFLLQANGISAWLFLIAFGAVNWTGLITRHNLAQPPAGIDWVYLTRDLDHTNAYLLVPYRDWLPAKADRYLARKLTAARNRRPTDWRDWNYADYRSAKRLPPVPATSHRPK